MNALLPWIIVVMMFCTLPSSPASAQDSNKVVVLSPRVGPIIDANHRNQYRLFERVTGFQNAIVYLTPAKNYFISFHLLSPGGVPRDTTVEYPESVLLIMAQKINHFEEIEEGTYRMGDDPTPLRLEDGEELKHFQWESSHGPRVLPDLLPFAEENGPGKETYPIFGFGVGLSSVSADFNGLASAFAAIENIYRLQGYDIPYHGTVFGLDILIWFNVRVRCSPAVLVLLEGGKSTGTPVDFRAVAVSGLYTFPAIIGDWFHPYAGIGIGRYYIDVWAAYGSRISEYTPGGSYYALDGIKVMGGVVGEDLKVGAELSRTPNFRLDCFGKYLFIPKLTTTTAEGIEASVKMGGVVVGALLVIYL